MGRARRRPGWSTDAQQVVDQLFVYGTLRAGQRARSLLADQIASSRPATLPGCIYPMPEGYPGLLAGGDETVVGELLSLRDLTSALPLIDAYEGDNFTRVLTVATDGDGRDTHAWCYVLRGSDLATGLAPIPGGDWFAVRDQ